MHDEGSFVYVVGTSDHTVVDSIPLGETIPYSAAVSPDGATLWVSISAEDSPHTQGIAVVDLATNTVTGIGRVSQDHLRDGVDLHIDKMTGG